MHPDNALKKQPHLEALHQSSATALLVLINLSRRNSATATLRAAGNTPSALTMPCL
ncbi:hypothetical protein XF_2212 [Xylella fastidiosa 9a5c]|uniref:Uncharacterized protein n=1 Tax=Xylella fastidiosa (strain 9a5c) TaxID=160492 RepID=Q9PBD2_XYLFA|nr:hypothetical protein XF_2212 [Xylella fastidiosa 9a5c]